MNLFALKSNWHREHENLQHKSLFEYVWLPKERARYGDSQIKEPGR